VFCPECGSEIPEGPFCQDCGADLGEYDAGDAGSEGDTEPGTPEDPQTTPDPGPGPDPVAGTADGGTVSITGSNRSPFLVIVLYFVTFGLYGLYWAWTASKSCRDFDDTGSDPHRPVKIGVILSIVSWLGFAAAVALPFLGLAGAAQGEPWAVFQAAFGLAWILIGGAALVGRAGGISTLVGVYRMWSWIEFHEKEIGYRDPLSAGSMLLIALVGYGAGVVLSFLGIGILVMIGVVAYILHRTQEGLNHVWSAAADGYTPERSPPHPA